MKKGRLSGRKEGYNGRKEERKGTTERKRKMKGGPTKVRKEDER